jgi:hypothetical protein
LNLPGCALAALTKPARVSTFNVALAETPRKLSATGTIGTRSAAGS